jgi:hypothetical protein
MDSSVSVDSASIIPSELLGQLPRRTRLSDRVGTVLGLTFFTTLGLAIFLWIGIHTWQDMHTRDALRREPSEAAGVVTKMRGLKAGYRVYYTFDVDGRSYTGDAKIPEKLGNSLRDSDPLPILYLPSNPDVNHPAASEEADPSVWIFVIGPSMLWVLSIAILLRLRMDRRLVAEGKPAIATITGYRRGARGGYYATYEFCTEDGLVTKGSGVPCDKDVKTGTNICVLYQPQKPRRNQMYQLLEYRVAE